MAKHWTMKPELAAHPGLFIFKAFTKLYGMAGVRLGYGLCADEDLLDANAARGSAVGGFVFGAGGGTGGAWAERNYVRAGPRR